MQLKRGWIVSVVVVALAIGACACIMISGMYGLNFYLGEYFAGGEKIVSSSSPTSTPVILRPTPAIISAQKMSDLSMVLGEETLKLLKVTEIPAGDFRELAMRLEGKQNIPLTVAPPVSTLELGAQQDFWVSNVDDNEYFQINATLQYMTDHVYFWIEDSVVFDQDDLQQLVETFENKIYPTNRAFFGSEWTPGVDGDPHLYIIYAGGLGARLAGYFSSADELHPIAHEHSNAHELFVLNSDKNSLDNEYTYGVLAHEFQHMIHWFRDRNEASWVNEGFSELAVFLNGYEVGSESSYIADPDIQLNDWPDEFGHTPPHYGASFLFLTYFLDRFGEEATKSLVGNPADDLEGVDQVLDQIKAQDLITGKKISADDVFTDWVIASYLKNEHLSDGRYTYNNFPSAPQAEETETIYDCPSELLTRDVHQYGVDYIRINCQGEYHLQFEGSTQAKVVPTEAHSEDFFYWSNKGDEGDMTLTRSFDFSDHEGELTLTFWTWYDIETDFDYVYTEVSEDGKNWEILVTPSGTAEDPSGNSYGWGYNGRSAGWVQESVDLSGYSGKEVQIRFEYVTDANVHGEGMLIDDVAIPEIGYYSDFEEGTDGWTSEGWLRINNVIPQSYSLALLTFGDTTEVIYIPLEEDNTAEIPLHLTGAIDEAVLVVIGTTRFTRHKAAYRLELRE